MRTWGSAAREAGAEQESIKACLGRGQKHHPPHSTFHNSATSTWEAHLPASRHHSRSEVGSSSHRCASLRALPGGRIRGVPFR